MDSLLSHPRYSLYIQARDRHFYFKKPDLSEASSLFKTCLACREYHKRSLNKKRKPLQELDPNIPSPQRKKRRPNTSRPKPQFTGQETRPEIRPIPTDPPFITLTSPENALPVLNQSETRPELPESRPEAAPLQP
jgi:hypothetical protein